MKYPIYFCEIFWPATNRDGERVIDSGGASYMFRSKPTAAELEAWKAQVWEEYRKKATAPGRPVFQITFQRWDTWCLGWFTHWTWDTGQTDADVLSSFERYVMETEVHNERKRWLGEDEDRCLMGAEDRWRWSGQPEDRKPPCRCDACKRLGVIRISH